MKKVILVVSFGTSHRDTLEETIGGIEKAISSAFQEYEIRRAFTSKMVMEKLRRRDGLHVDNVAQALERLAEEGAETVILQPTHVVNGLEYDAMVIEARRWQSRFRTLGVGVPLLSSGADYERLCTILIKELCPPEDTGLVLVGHGTSHCADAAYGALSYRFIAMGKPNIVVGTVEGYPDLETTVKRVLSLGLDKVVLAPLMVVAGDHATNDLAGGESGSWKSAFEKAGCQVRCLLMGLGQSPGVQNLYVSHVQDTLNSMGIEDTASNE